MPDVNGPFTSGDAMARIIEGFKEVAADTQLDIRQDTAAMRSEALNSYKTIDPPPEAGRGDKKITKGERLQKIVKPDKMKMDQQKLKYKEVAKKFNQKSTELDPDKLASLAEDINEENSEDTILDKIKNLFPDDFLTDQVFDFLLEVTSGPLNEKITTLQERHFKEHEKTILAGRNISESALKYSKELSKPPQEMREQYISFLDSQKGLVDQFWDILGASPTYKDYNLKVNFLRHSLGEDLHADASSIEKEKLMVLVKQSNALQVLGTVPKELDARWKTMKLGFKEADIPFPQKLDLLNMTKMEFNLLRERYPTQEKVIHLAEEGGVSQTKGIIVVVESLLAISQKIHHKLYSTAQHRSDVIKSIVDAATDLYQKEEGEENAANIRSNAHYLSETDEDPNIKTVT